MMDCDHRPGDPDRKESISCAAIVFAQTKATFTAQDFAEFLLIGGIPVVEESADEFLSDLADQGRLRQIGPGVYAAKVSA
jgi:hypothetical protein